MNYLKFLTYGSVLVTLFSFSALAHQGATGIVGDRMNAMTEMGKALKAAQTSLGQQNFEEAQSQAQSIMTHARNIPTAFEVEEYGQGSDAKTEIWSDPEAFAVAGKTLETEIQILLDALVAQKPDLAQAAFRKVGASCGQCHFVFRNPKN